MQLYAMEDNLLVAASKAQRGKSYVCPECRSWVRVRGGPFRTIHFYHLSRVLKCKQHQKSKEHLQLQCKLVDLIGQDAQMEVRFDGIDRIADVAWHAKKIVFEIQRSAISVEEVKGRNLDYERAGYAVIWVLHEAQFNRGRMSAAEHFLRGTQCYFTDIDTLGDGIIYDQFEVILGYRRVFKGPKLPVAPDQILDIPPAPLPDRALPHLLLSRLENSRLYAKGDLLDRILKEKDLSASLQRMLLVEAQKGRKKIEGSPLPLRELLKRSYLGLLDWLQGVVD